MENVTMVMAAISAVIGVIATIYKMLFRNDVKRVEKYYEEILKPFIIDYHKDRNVNVINFLDNKAERDNDVIPKYIFYLLDNGKEKSEDLKKVLLYDYIDIYPNDNNKMLRFMEMISKFLVFVMFTMSFSFLLYGAVSFSFCLILFLQFISENIRLAFELLGLSIICFVSSGVSIQMTRLINEDMYTLKEKRIRKLIQRKIKYYDKNITKYIF